MTAGQAWYGLEADRLGVTPGEGEVLRCTDSGEIYVGDASTAGGLLIGQGGRIVLRSSSATAIGTAFTDIPWEVESEKNGVVFTHAASSVEITSVIAGTYRLDVRALLQQTTNLGPSHVQWRLRHKPSGGSYGAHSYGLDDVSQLVNNASGLNYGRGHLHGLIPLGAGDAIKISARKIVGTTNTITTIIDNVFLNLQHVA